MIAMKKICTHQGYDFYICENHKLYNIAPQGTPAPEGGYRNKQYIEKIKGITFPKES